MFNFLKNNKKELVQEPKDELAEILIASLTLEPSSWEVKSHTIKHASGVEIWISNRPYADLKLYGTLGGPDEPIGNDSQKRIIREIIDRLSSVRIDGKSTSPVQLAINQIKEYHDN